MNVGELIASLERMTQFDDLNLKAKVKAYDAESGYYEDVTGFLYSPKDNTIELQTDSDESDEEEE